MLITSLLYIYKAIIKQNENSEKSLDSHSVNRARRATDRRNTILHNLWAQDLDNNPVIRDDDHTFRPAPLLAELDAVADELATVASELNDARLDGFLKEALSQ